MSESSRDAHSLRRRTNLVLACIFLGLNLLVLAALLPVMIDSFSKAVGQYEDMIPIPDHR